MYQLVNRKFIFYDLNFNAAFEFFAVKRLYYHKNERE